MWTRLDSYLMDIFLLGFSLSSCPQRILKVILLLNPKCFLNFVLNCQQNFKFFIFRSGLFDSWIKCNRINEDLLYYLQKPSGLMFWFTVLPSGLTELA
jgi:hypothetical protein